MTRLEARRNHLLRCAAELRRLPLDSVHPCGVEVWLLISITVDALMRVEGELLAEASRP